jgi:1-acyl-sn-glycerol-3-phosphate acyltransferase
MPVLYHIAWWFFNICFRILFAVMGGFRVVGTKNMPRRGPVIVTPNHLSFADPPAVGIAIGRPAWYMATDELFTMPILGKLARFMHGFPVRQDSPDRKAIRFAEQLLEKGEAVVIFPEGHVSKTGEFQEVQAGVILIAVRTGAPVLPVGIVGSGQFMPPHQWKIHRSQGGIRIAVGRPIPVEELTGGLSGRAALDYGAAYLGREIQKLIAEAAGQEVPALVSQPTGQPAEQSSEEPLAMKRDCRV